MFGPEMDRGRTRQFMVSQHRGQKLADGTPYFRHPALVAKLSESWGVRFFRRGKFILPIDQATIENMWHVGILHDVIEDGRATWDDILEITNLEVANLVSVLSHDNRLSRPRRVQEYANRLFHADIPAKIVKLADLCCNLRDALELLWRDPEAAKTALEGWPDEVLKCVKAIEKLKGSRLKAEWIWSQETGLDLTEIFGKWQRREDILREIHACPGIPLRGAPGGR